MAQNTSQSKGTDPTENNENTNANSRQNRIQNVLLKEFSPQKIDLLNESHQHGGGRNGPAETHYNLFMVSTHFEGVSRVKRQQMVMTVLKSEFESGLHALTMKLQDDKEFENNPSAGNVSPACASVRAK
jgi:stress-induced morphogen